jgi:hypothetical protein
MLILSQLSPAIHCEVQRTSSDSYIYWTLLYGVIQKWRNPALCV